MQKHDTFLYIYIYIFLERSEIDCRRVEETGKRKDEEHGHILAEGCDIDLFLIHIVIPLPRLYVFASLTTKPPPGFLPATHWPLSKLLDCPTEESSLSWLTVWRGYPCLYNFITLTRRSSSCQLMWPAYIIGTSCPRHSWLTTLSNVNKHYSP